MEQSFWQDRWSAGRIGFHQPEANSALKKYLDRLETRAGEGCLLAPLCGKSHDLTYLARAGFVVHGVEFVEQAIRSFFLENDMLFQEFPDGCYQGLAPELAERISLWRRDFFTLRRDELPLVNSVYDRAALIALPPETRRRYAAHVTGLAVPGCLQLLVTLDYDQSEMDGPPHAVSPAEVDELYGSDWSVEPLESNDALAGNERFAEQGLTRLEETVYLLRRRA